MFEAVPSLAVDHPDAVESADDQQGPGDADAHRGQHPRHVPRLRRAETHRHRTGTLFYTTLVTVAILQCKNTQVLHLSTRFEVLFYATFYSVTSLGEIFDFLIHLSALVTLRSLHKKHEDVKHENMFVVK